MCNTVWLNTKEMNRRRRRYLGDYFQGITFRYSDMIQILSMSENAGDRSTFQY